MMMSSEDGQMQQVRKELFLHFRNVNSSKVGEEMSWRVLLLGLLLFCFNLILNEREGCN